MQRFILRSTKKRIGMGIAILMQVLRSTVLELQRPHGTMMGILIPRRIVGPLRLLEGRRSPNWQLSDPRREVYLRALSYVLQPKPLTSPWWWPGIRD